ncbi:MAG: GerAB/ArcD/ProY family transporter [Clostridia bacterium]|nr:GerAB/ArcD/ProY family transporter [Clostridia bacterium]
MLGLFEEVEPKNMTFPFFSAMHMIEVGNFLERIDAIHMSIWVLSSFIAIATFYYLASLGIIQVLGLEDYKPTVAPLGIIIVSLSFLLFNNLAELNEFLTRIVPPYTAIFLVFFPYLMLLAALVRKIGGGV